ncbi:crcb-like protein [Heliomicrobium modesticaldum Ice1]|uniref:Fluoride-specific ion channel FluC n=1 Tax=Heliobacterium modesticaldum (strain ATCC 51547 / Ice1) TaxID=498761 RepID=B0TB33_HELMI|nr:CrcB family protein [Heliomicrobium modesticaldum]ABZ83760.1 crcb-like protein [Heliomicrobium modesticaldum Ice1]
MEILIIGIGGIAGALSRYAIGKYLSRIAFLSFPTATFLINVTGSFFLGLLAMNMVQHPTGGLIEKYGFQVGFLGAYTTFSTFTYESIRLIEEGEWMIFFLYTAGSTIAGLVACLIGISLKFI